MKRCPACNFSILEPNQRVCAPCINLRLLEEPLKPRAITHEVDDRATIASLLSRFYRQPKKKGATIAKGRQRA